jgi:hypothetical protein
MNHDLRSTASLERFPKCLLEKHYVVEAVSGKRHTLLGRKLWPLRRSKLSSGLLAQRQASSSKPAVLGVSSVDEFLDRLEPVYPQMYPI